jgi:hypothetical protein
VPACVTHEVIITSDGGWLVTDCVMIKNNCRYYAALNEMRGDLCMVNFNEWGGSCHGHEVREENCKTSHS